jgi:tRNA pseudouridine38-40 synthase
VLSCACRRVELAQGPGLVAGQSAIEIRVAADGFLPRMVRNIVGALVEVGQGRRNQEWIAEVLDARDRRLGSVLAPPQGLTLWRVGFGDDALETW